jgi:hypothetical protein
MLTDKIYNEDAEHYEHLMESMNIKKAEEIFKEQRTIV